MIFFFWLYDRVRGILVTRPRTKPTFPTVESQSLDPEGSLQIDTDIITLEKNSLTPFKSTLYKVWSV